MKPPQSQFTLVRADGTGRPVCRRPCAARRPRLALLGAGVLVVVPGFVLERARGGTGIIGGIVSGCLIPMGLASLWAAVEYLFGNRPIRETLDFFPALYLLFVVCLVWSSLASSVLFLVDRRLPGRPRSNRRPYGRRSTPGIRFLPDEDGPGNVPRTRYVPVNRAPAARGGPDR